MYASKKGCINGHEVGNGITFFRFAETRAANPGGVGTGSSHSKVLIEPGYSAIRCVTSAGVFIIAVTAAPVRLYSLRLEVWLL
jgi:hypothetical protein